MKIEIPDEKTISAIIIYEGKNCGMSIDLKYIKTEKDLEFFVFEGIKNRLKILGLLPNVSEQDAYIINKLKEKENV